MNTLAPLLCVLFIYSISLAQSNRYANKTQQIPDPLANTEVKKEQRVERGDLKGPRAKNHPTHQYRASKVVVAPAEASEKRMGPAAKNYRPWQDDTRTKQVVVTKKKRKNLKGPRAKNHKPWDD